MNINIELANTNYIIECVNILRDSEMGSIYFSDYEKTSLLITNAIADKELYVATGNNKECFGFIYYKSQGMLGSYPYLHIVAVKKGYRNRGIGRQLISFFEDHSSNYSTTKYFLTVDDFNEKAKRLYEDLGYICVCVLPDFYKKGISIYLMMKCN